jgi:choline-sulfatase
VPDQRLNVVLLVADDLGSWALGCYGNTEILTPHLDALAERGTLYSDFYCTSPVCSPARASLLTGHMPSVHGVHDWIARSPGAGRSPSFLDGQETFVDVLSASGYRTGLFGKWHLGDASTAHAGFERWLALEASHGPYIDADFVTDDPDDDVRGYVTDVIADRAIDFVRATEHDDRPFLASVNFTAPHHPWVDQHPERITSLYDDCNFASCPQESPHPWMHQSLAPAVRDAYRDPRPSLVGYFAAVTAMDEAIGRILENVEAAGLAESTVIVFTSDNGFHCGQQGIWGKGNSTWPLNVYERSVKVPCIVAGPGWAEGQTSRAVTSAYDIFPTVLEVAGLATDSPERPGMPLPRSASTPEAGGAVVCDEYGDTRMIRRGHHKLVLRYPEGPCELYDLRADPQELRNQYDDPAAATVRRELTAQLEDWFERYASGPYDARRYEVTGRGQTEMRTVR